MWITKAANADVLHITFDNPVPPLDVVVNSRGTHFSGGGGKDGEFVVDGTAGIQLTIQNLNWTDPPGNVFAHGTDLRQSDSVLLEAREIGNFEGVVNVALGLSHLVCPSVAIASRELAVSFARS